MSRRCIRRLACTYSKIRDRIFLAPLIPPRERSPSLQGTRRERAQRERRTAPTDMSTPAFIDLTEDDDTPPPVPQPPAPLPPPPRAAPLQQPQPSRPHSSNSMGRTVLPAAHSASMGRPAASRSIQPLPPGLLPKPKPVRPRQATFSTAPAAPPHSHSRGGSGGGASGGGSGGAPRRPNLAATAAARTVGGAANAPSRLQAAARAAESDFERALTAHCNAQAGSSTAPAAAPHSPPE